MDGGGLPNPAPLPPAPPEVFPINLLRNPLLRDFCSGAVFCTGVDAAEPRWLDDSGREASA